MRKLVKQQAKPLSPENYIKTKARSLPIFKCLITANWKATRLAQIAVIRAHTNGNYTFGSYLVDLFALGTKDSMYKFNVSPFVVKDLERMTNFVEVDYNLVHNIIFGSNKFAIKNGFKIHKDFEKITQHILEIDNDKIPFIELEFGKEGKPLII